MASLLIEPNDNMATTIFVTRPDDNSLRFPTVDHITRFVRLFVRILCAKKKQSWKEFPVVYRHRDTKCRCRHHNQFIRYLFGIFSVQWGFNKLMIFPFNLKGRRQSVWHLKILIKSACVERHFINCRANTNLAAAFLSIVCECDNIESHFRLDRYSVCFFIR